MAVNFAQTYKFSPLTGNALEERNGVLTDVETGEKHYLNPKPCVNVLIGDEKGRVLLVRRASEPHMGTWDVPGGFIEIGEMVEECAVREMAEELGVKVVVQGLIGSSVESYEFEGVVYPLIIIDAVAGLEGEIKEAMDDISEWKWFEKEEVPWEEITIVSIPGTLRRFFERKS